MTTIHVCQGPPECDGNLDPCPWCRTILIDEDGTETVQEPARA